MDLVIPEYFTSIIAFFADESASTKYQSPHVLLIYKHIKVMLTVKDKFDVSEKVERKVVDAVSFFIKPIVETKDPNRGEVLRS